MPRRNHKLTWQTGTTGRGGRWRKKYKNNVYYFSGGRGKSDQEAYRKALAEWEVFKTRIDGQAPKPHQEEYERAANTWEQVLTWCRKHQESMFAEIAEEKLESLRRRLAAPKLKPLGRSDTFEALFDMPVIPLANHHVGNGIDAESAKRLKAVVPAELDGAALAKYTDELDGSPMRIAREIWRDRLDVQKQTAASPDEGLRAHVDCFLKEKEGDVKAGELSVGRLYKLGLHLNHFADWFGRDTAVTEINGRTLTDYRLKLLERVERKEWARTTAGDHLVTLKSFIRWLWQIEAIASLPRNMDSKSQSLRIGKPAGKIVVFTMDEIKTLLDNASDRTKLYILLMLNCAMTQKDISDLHTSEVDWRQHTITRKRSKTAESEHVPVVTYVLWPETLRLLKQERSADREGRVLTNSNGGPLWFEELNDQGKYRKTDNVKSAFDRLRRKTGITKPAKSLKKTSASCIRDNKHFTSLESLFLGHAPVRMADRHYAQVPEQLLAEAIRWLGHELGVT